MISPLHRAIEAPGLVMSPMGVAEQSGVSTTAEFVTKKRLTHDFSLEQIQISLQKSKNIQISLQNAITVLNKKKGFAIFENLFY